MMIAANWNRIRRCDWVGKIFSKELDFDHRDKRLVHRPESILENKTYEILWDLKMQIDPSILTRRPDLVGVNKKITFQLVDFNILANYEVEVNESKKVDKYWTLPEGWKSYWM